MKTIYTTLRAVNPRVYTIAFAAMLLGLVAFYMYLVGMSVVHVVINKEVAQKMTSVESEITELESQYIEAQHSMRSEIALQRGFVPQEHKVFISARDSAVVLSTDDR